MQSIYYICSDPNYPEIKYYYIPYVFMDIAQSLTEVDPFQAYQFVYSYPCSGSPESSMTITSGIPLEARPNSLPAFTVPSYLGFTPVSGVVSSSDLDTINIHSSKVYERVALLVGESSLSDSKSVERAFYYDYLGRIVQTVEKNHLGGTSRTSYKYDFTGNILSLYESHQSSSSASADTKLTNYSYDSRSRLLSETTSVNSQVSVTVSYSYDNLGKLIAKTYGNGVKEDLTYNVQGWLKSKNTAKSGANIFNMTLRYYDPLYANSVSLYSGNISEIEWQHAAGTNNAYAFSYDKLGRLLNTTRYLNGTSQTSFTERGIDYDNNGNIELLKRYGSSASSPQDNFIYNYNGNTLTSITGTINASYSHDGNGNITVDGRQNLQIEYNLFNLPKTVKQGSVSKALYSWLSDGTRASVVEDTLSNTGYYYLGSMVYSSDQGVKTLESVSFSSGQIIHTTGTYSPYYHTTDHLGSIRAITNSTGSIAEQNDYYPFGKRTNLGQSYSLLSVNRYKYNGKEEQTVGDLQYLDYGARFYDPTIARWLSVDPLAHEREWVSPYNFVQNNPINRVDPTGALDNPIYDQETGGLLGTDDNGLKGSALVMKKEDFKQGMNHEEALKKDVGIGNMTPKAMANLTESFTSLPSRPDYDGYLTLDEANKWYREGNGQPLFTSLAKIDLSGIYSLGENYVGDEDHFNLLLNSASLNDGLVYGSITLKRYPDHQVRAYADKYDFKSHNPWNPLNWPRNGEAYIGGKYAGKGQEYSINIYGSKKLTPILPWIK